MNKLLDSLNIVETDFTRITKRPTKFTNVYDNIPHVKNANHMADLLMLPTTKQGYKYLLVVTDLATKNVDFEPLKNKEPDDILKALKTIYSREYLKLPYYSLTTDGGSEFKGKFHNYLYENNILHSVGLSGRHSQTGSVEILNKQIGYALNLYMNNIELRTGKIYREWTNILQPLRTEINKIKEIKTENPYTQKFPLPDTLDKKPKFKVGDIVHHQLDKPKNALGHELYGNFRMGDYRFDTTPRKIERIFIYDGPETFRYQLDTMPNVSFTEAQLMKSKEKEVKYIVQRIVKKRVKNNKNEYFIKWKGYDKKYNTWETEKKLLEDGLKNMIDDFNKL